MAWAVVQPSIAMATHVELASVARNLIFASLPFRRRLLAPRVAFLQALRELAGVIKRQHGRDAVWTAGSERGVETLLAVDGGWEGAHWERHGLDITAADTHLGHVASRGARWLVEGGHQRVCAALEMACRCWRRNALLDALREASGWGSGGHEEKHHHAPGQH